MTRLRSDGIRHYGYRLTRRSSCDERKAPSLSGAEQGSRLMLHDISGCADNIDVRMILMIESLFHRHIQRDQVRNYGGAVAACQGKNGG